MDRPLDSEWQSLPDCAAADQEEHGISKVRSRKDDIAISSSPKAWLAIPVQTAKISLGKFVGP